MAKIKQKLEERIALRVKFLGNKSSFLRELPNFYEAARNKGGHCSVTGLRSQKSEFGFSRTAEKSWGNPEGGSHKKGSPQISTQFALKLLISRGKKKQ